MRKLAWVLFDVNGTLLDPSSIAEPLGGSEEDRRLVAGAFTEALLLTMADSLSGGAYRPLPDYIAATLERALRVAGRDTGALTPALERASAMDPFPDARAALSNLADAGLRVGVLTNSTAAAAGRALREGGLRDALQVVIGSDATKTFKPQLRIYEHAAATLDVAPSEICLVAAHSWDVMGAMRAGMRGAWIARGERWLMPIVPEPDLRGEDLTDIARKLITHMVPESAQPAASGEPC
jgi:2-haloacid dehalogenase